MEIHLDGINCVVESNTDCCAAFGAVGDASRGGFVQTAGILSRQSSGRLANLYISRINQQYS